MPGLGEISGVRNLGAEMGWRGFLLCIPFDKDIDMLTFLVLTENHYSCLFAARFEFFLHCAETMSYNHCILINSLTRLKNIHTV